MAIYERTGVWIVLIGVAIVALVLNGRVGDLKSTVQDHTNRLDQTRLEAVVLPGVPAALAERWTEATQDRYLTPQDHLWLTLHLTNIGQNDVEELAADLSLLPAIHGLYPYSETTWTVSNVIEDSPDQTRVKVTFRDLSAGDSHTVFIAVRPANMVGPPYAKQAQSQWVGHYQLYWKQLSITVRGKPRLIRYGLASTWFPITQYAAKP